jgi:membrane associated rhomboid family serine protease
MLYTIGASRFLQLYLASGISASVASLGFKSYLGRDYSSLGASGSISGLMTTYALVYPRSQILLFAIIPVPAPIALGLFIGYDIYSASKFSERSIVDNAGHLGGVTFGFYFAKRILRI